MSLLSIWDVILIPLFLLIIYFLAKRVQSKKLDENPEYKFFIYGLFAKIFGGIALCLVYMFHYGGGDTINYFKSSMVLNNLMYEDWSTYLSILGGNLSAENYSSFSSDTGWPMYWRDPMSFSIVRYVSVLVFFGFRSYLATTILLATITYSGLWRLFRVFYKLYPEIMKQLAFSILFVPSVVFWGSAILKDSITISAVALIAYSFFSIIMYKSKILKNLIVILICIFLLISIKPYIFFAVFIGIIITLIFLLVRKIKVFIIKATVFPILLIAIFLLSNILISMLGSVIGGRYSSVESLLENAVVVQDDLKTSDRYGPNTFDIGAFDATITGVLSKTPSALMAGLFRPFLWESRNIVVLFSGIENLFLLLMFLTLIFVLIKSSLMSLVELSILKEENLIIRFFSILYYSIYIVFSIILSFLRNSAKVVSNDPVLIFSIVFSLFFAFFIGLTSANFGALVRYKIPLLPFFFSALFIIRYKYKREKFV